MLLGNKSKLSQEKINTLLKLFPEWSIKLYIELALTLIKDFPEDLFNDIYESNL